MTSTNFPPEFSFSDFRPDPPMVPAGGITRLHWRGDPAEYTLSWATVDGGQSGENDVSDVNCWDSPTLYGTAVFRLAARMPGSDAERVLSTTVTVANPTLNTHDLAVDGPVRMMRASRPMEVQRGQTRSFRVPTDGLLLGWLQANTGGHPTTISVVLRTENDFKEHRVLFTSDNSDPARVPRETCFDLPVQQGMTVSVTCGYLSPSVPPEAAEPFYAIRWLPFGTLTAPT